MNGLFILNGRVEIYYNNIWGIVCDDFFNNNVVVVVCNMLGF